MFDTLLVQPVFNLLVLIYGLIPGHDFGVAIILFTIIVRMAMWPLVRKQLHHTKLMRDLQPDIKKIKEKSEGDKQRESQLLMELYKERGVNPFSSLGLLFVQIPIFLGLFRALHILIENPEALRTETYSWVKALPHMQTVIDNLDNFKPTFLGFVDMTDKAIGANGILWPAMSIAIFAGIIQLIQTRMLMPKDKSARSLRQILKESSEGKEPDQSEIMAVTSQKMFLLFAPLITYICAISPAGLSLYIAAGSLVGVLQQRWLLHKDVEEMEAEAPVKTTVRTLKKGTKSAPAKKTNKGRK